MILQFTPRQKLVLSLIAQGHTRKRIAHGLNLSIHCVNAHCSDAKAKFSTEHLNHTIALGVILGEINPITVLESVPNIGGKEFSDLTVVCERLHASALDMGSLIFKT